MPIIKVNSKIVLFVHIPKTGGTTVESYFRQLGRIGFFYGRMKQDFYQCTPQHFDVELLQPLFPDSFIDYRFAIIRHPLDRAISEYKMRVGRRFLDGHVIPSFAKWIDKQSNALQDNPRILDNHMNLQVNFLNDKTKVFRFEDGLINAIKQIQNDLGVSFDFTKDYHGQKSVSSLNIDVTEKDMATVGKIYTRDFEELGYKMEDAKILQKK